MRVALVGAELEENLALRYLHAAIQQAGNQAQIFDFHAPGQTAELAGQIADYRPALVGLSMVFTARAREFLDLAATLRTLGVTAHITAGGHFAAFHAQRLLADFPAVDSVIHGEGEEVLVELIENLARHGGLVEAASIAGLTARQPDGRPIHGGPRPNPPDLDARAFPTRPERFHHYLGRPIANMLSGRGCYGHCRFCSIQAWHRQNGGPRFRQRSVENVATEMAGLYHQRGVRIFNFHDDNFLQVERGPNLERLNGLRRELDARGVGRIGIQIKARPDSIEPEVVAALRRIGLFRVFLGVETDAVAGLVALGRGIRRGQNHAALDVLRQARVHTCFNLLMFSPETRLADLRENVAFLGRQDWCPLNFCRVEVYAGTAIERRLRHENRLVGDYFGHDYRIADPQVQSAFEIFREVFWPRNFADNGMNHRAMQLDYYYHLLEHFQPERVPAGMEAKVKGLIGRLNHNSGELLDEICRYAASPCGAPARFARQLAARRERFDARMDRSMRDALETIVRRAGPPPTRRARGLMSAAASMAAAALLAAAEAPAQPPTHMCEMIARPLRPGPTLEVQPVEKKNDKAPADRLPKDRIAEVCLELRVAYEHQLLRLAENHRLLGRSVTLRLKLDAKGGVAESEISLGARKQGTRTEAEFRKEFDKLVEKWSFRDVGQAGSCELKLRFKPPKTDDKEPQPDTHMHERAPRPAFPPG